jgi:hypothetical protein
MGETMDAIKEMLRAISGLVDELKLTVASSKKEGVIHNADKQYAKPGVRLPNTNR